ncbi:hypothetical protein MFLO_14067 [Listeria floridensis FSL S10-1187]|uniref:Alpha/beta hydrolase fold-5 domain-containing protein n=1 Tax=Listeria floridensis FSL S10-1187 TaxID=1265817 RepID=A0ABP3AXG1_9LIST|nr:alpha/beta hydrolase [Listeria floridensis]EUJ26492.1 hypothetical protein MFLO_14067 [Listeria floridensis FSL S10-1187]
MKKLIGFGSLLILGLLLVWGYFYFNTSPSENAMQAANETSKVDVLESDNTLIFEPKETTNKVSIILYPGAFVNALSYAPLAKNLAEHGYKTYIPEMPFDLAVFGKNKAEAIIDQNRDEEFVIGGHSLGGVMASRFANEHADQLKGIFYLASYPDKKGEIKGTNLAALSITATRDGVLNQTKYKENKRYLPNDTTFTEIKGGNHAQFGSYGKQNGDRKATISEEKQTSETSQAMISWLEKIKLK